MAKQISIDDVKDEDSLRVYLKALPQGTEAEQAEARRIAVTLANRAAARVLPAYWEWTIRSEDTRERDLTALPVLRSVLISAVAAKLPTADIKRAADAAAYAAAATYATDAAAAYAAADAAANAAANATDAAAAYAAADAAANATDAAAFAANATDAAAFATDAAAFAANATAVWAAIRSDLRALQAGNVVFDQSLWPDINPLQAEWDDIRNKVTASDDAEDWQFWINWYDQMLDPKGQEPNWPLLEQIALIKPKVWDAGPVVVSKAISDVQTQFELRDEAKQLKAELAAAQEELAFLAQRSHNHPPELIHDTVAVQARVSEVEANLDRVADELEKLTPDKPLLRKCAEAILAAAQAIASYCGSVANDVIRAGAKPFGAAGGTFAADKLFNDGRLVEYATKLLSFAAGG